MGMLHWNDMHNHEPRTYRNMRKEGSMVGIVIGLVRQEGYVLSNSFFDSTRLWLLILFTWPDLRFYDF
jgi:hypothetical protein